MNCEVENVLQEPPKEPPYLGAGTIIFPHTTSSVKHYFFSYNVKRRNKNGTVDWQCCLCHKTVNCRGTVKQNGEVFTPRAVAALPPSRTRDDAGPQDSSSRGGGCPEQRLLLSRPDRQQGFSRPRQIRPDAVPPQAHVPGQDS